MNLAYGLELFLDETVMSQHISFKLKFDKDYDSSKSNK